MPLIKDLVNKQPIPAELKTKQKDYLPVGILPIIDQGQQLIGGYSDDTSKVLSCNLPAIVFGDHTRAVKYLDMPFGAGADGIKVLLPKTNVCPKYLYYGLQYIVSKMPDRGYSRQYQYVEKENLSLPEYNKQERIVAHIEELFSQLDSGVETLKKTKQQLEVYRQAVLKEAFSCCDKMVSIESVCSHVTDGDHMPPPKSTTGIPFIMISNVENNRICWDKTAFVDKTYYNTIDSKRKPQNGDVLYTVTGSYGIPILVDYEKEFCFQRHIALLRPKTTILQKYLYFALMEPSVYAQAPAQATGTAQKTVGLGVLRRIQIPYTNIENQRRIVQKIEICLSVYDSIVRTVEGSLTYADYLKHSILKQAFEGRE